MEEKSAVLKSVPSAQSAKKNGFIELCRFLFMMGIVSHHAMFLPNPGYIPIWGGYISTDFFFILGGYFLLKDSQKAGLGDFGQDSAINQVYKKFRQFYPYFFVSIVISFALYHIANNQMQIHTILVDLLKGIPQLLFLSQAGLGGMNHGVTQYIGTMWYASVLMVGLLVVYPLMRWSKTYFPTAVAPVLTLACYGYIFTQFDSLGVVNQWCGFCYAGCLRAVGGLCLGAFLNYLVHAIPKHKLTPFGDVVISLVQLAAIASSFYLMAHSYGYTDLMQVMLFSVLIVVSFSEDSILNRLCNREPCFALGKLSMVIFVTQGLAYSYPSLLPYPEQWVWRYMAYIAYVMLFSVANYVLCLQLKRLHMTSGLKRILCESDQNR